MTSGNKQQNLKECVRKKEGDGGEIDKDRHTDKQRNRERERERESQTDRQTDRGGWGGGSEGEGG